MVYGYGGAYVLAKVEGDHFRIIHSAAYVRRARPCVPDIPRTVLLIADTGTIQFGGLNLKGCHCCTIFVRLWSVSCDKIRFQGRLNGRIHGNYVAFVAGKV